jgi:hypothetical protein
MYHDPGAKNGATARSAASLGQWGSLTGTYVSRPGAGKASATFVATTSDRWTGVSNRAWCCISRPLGNDLSLVQKEHTMPTEFRFDDLDLREESVNSESESGETDGTGTEICGTHWHTCLC